MSGCLIFHRPDICSTTSLRVQPRLDGRRRVELADGLQPRDQPAVLRDVVAGGADVLGDLAQHGAGVVLLDDRAVRRRAGVAAGAAVGLDDVPAHRPRLGRADEDAAALVAAHHLVGVGVAQLVDLDVVELEPAAPAAALPQLGGADAALLLADLLVQRDEAVVERPGLGGPLGPQLLDLGVDLGGGRVARRGQLRDPGLGRLALSWSARPPGSATTPAAPSRRGRSPRGRPGGGPASRSRAAGSPAPWATRPARRRAASGRARRGPGPGRRRPRPWSARARGRSARSRRRRSGRAATPVSVSSSASAACSGRVRRRCASWSSRVSRACRSSRRPWSA